MSTMLNVFRKPFLGIFAVKFLKLFTTVWSVDRSVISYNIMPVCNPETLIWRKDSYTFLQLFLGKIIRIIICPRTINKQTSDRRRLKLETRNAFHFRHALWVWVTLRRRSLPDDDIE